MQAEEYDFIKLGEGDIDELLELERRCFTHPWNETQYAVGLRLGVFHVFGFTGPGGLAAYASFSVAADEMELLNIAVRPESRRRGLGRRLLRIILGIAGRMGAKRAVLDVRETNSAARELYRGFGFEQVGVRRKYYPDTGEDALTLSLELQEPRA